MSEVLEFALRYANSGRSVIPLHDCHSGKCSCDKYNCQSPGKHPRIGNWPNNATRDDEVIRRWFMQWPHANIGLPLEGLVCIDVDPRNNGDETFSDLIALHGALPDTWVQRTGGGGWHYIFKANGDKYRGGIGAGVDIKFGSHQYIVAEPSIHASGHKYVFDDGCAPYEGAKLAHAPKWIAEAAVEKKTERAPDGSIISGSRNNYLYERARRLRDIGFSSKAIFAALIEHNIENCKPPLSNEEVHTIAKSAGMNEPETNAKTSPNFIGITDFINSLEAPTWLINGMVQSGYVYAMTGHTSHGKTVVASLVSAAVASGNEFAGRPTNGGRVLYMAGENQQDFGWHLCATLQYLDKRSETLDGKFWIMPQRDTLSAISEETKEFCETIGGVSLIVVDTSAAYSGVIDENSNAQVISHALAMREMTKFPGHPAVLALCHPSKNATKDSLDPRGGSSFLCEIDANLTVAMNDGIIEIGHTKIRGPSFGSINLQLEVVDIKGRADSAGNKIVTSIAKYISSDQAEKIAEEASGDDAIVLLAIYEFPNHTTRQIAECLGWRNAKGEPEHVRVIRCLKRLIRDKLLDQLHNKKYRLTPNGLKEVRFTKKS